MKKLSVGFQFSNNTSLSSMRVNAQNVINATWISKQLAVSNFTSLPSMNKIVTTNVLNVTKLSEIKEL